ncbi:hypothetical protein CDL15_Pgr026514 [Punica granatum]|uniref:Transmembrane protein 45A-like n=1 Tax=Punica granatum TaxID=22663 RepID=A0A218WKT7_PUNGR|nr:hypothetical protein CDL15_Pgr026514 [Punica granatum]PKH57329.1 hypothetical protein CRG98_050297 [Punica granatum]
MGSLVGHVAPGFGFFIIGLWHLFNNIRLHPRAPSSYSSLPWFPAPRIRYLELYVIFFGCSLYLVMELFVGPARHQPLDPDGTISSNHLRNFEHSLVALSFLTYAALAIVFDRVARPAKACSRALYDLTRLVGATAFAQELLLFHLHSTDHKGLEGQYHLFLQIVIFVSLTSTLIGIAVPTSFIIIFVRLVSILFQGIWFMVTGFMLWTPELMPKGCFLNNEDGQLIARCHNDEALRRAKSLVNIKFSCFLMGVTIFSISLYLILSKIYGGKVEYRSLDTETNDMESQNISKQIIKEFYSTG